ncbi:MAG TPA: hypothetical protein VE685_27845 [Thermoanaerobaculia bacterium]|nr:hypothetical protein [Thermoanaerobaculia bacterium]
MSDDRKYRQRGYQDSGNRDVRSRLPQGPREKKEGPRGRGLGAPSETVFRCAACGEKRPLFDEIPFDATCARCNADLHTCSNCVNFDTSVRWECRRWEEIPARVPKKRDRNECTLFTPKTTQEFAKDSDKPSPGDARSAFDALFKF